MPTAAHPKVTLTVGELTPNLREVELGNIGANSSNDVIANYDRLRVSATPNNRFYVHKGRTRLPALSRWCIYFGPMILIAGLTFLPLYVAIMRPNEYIINHWAQTECKAEQIWDWDDGGPILVNISYTDSGGEYHAELVEYDLLYYYREFFIVDFWGNMQFEKIRTFQCYYRDETVIPTPIAHYYVDSARDSAIHVSAGLGGAWLLIATITLGCWGLVIKRDQKKPDVTKELFERDKRLMEVVDWGEVDAEIRQPLHAILFSFCVPENPDMNDIDTKKVAITQFTKQPRRWRGWIPCFSFMFFAGCCIMLGFAWVQDKRYNVVVLWNLGTLFFVVPILMTCIWVSGLTNIQFTATAEVNCKKLPTEDIRITNAGLSPLGLGGKLLAADVARHVIN